MKRKRHTPEQIVRKLREGDRLLNEGKDLAEVLRHLEVSESSWARWRARYGGMKADEAKRLKELERENARHRARPRLALPVDPNGPSACRPSFKVTSMQSNNTTPENPGHINRSGTTGQPQCRPIDAPQGPYAFAKTSSERRPAAPGHSPGLPEEC